MRICVVTFPISEAGTIPLNNLMLVIKNLSSEVSLITGDAGYRKFKRVMGIHTYNVTHKAGATTITRAMNYIVTQLKISCTLLKTLAQADMYIFFIGGEGLLLPMLLARLLRKRIVLALAGVPSASSTGILSTITALLSRVGFAMPHRIIVYSKRITAERMLGRHKDKIAIAHEHWIDFDKFAVTKQLVDRTNTVGYIGALSEAKGVPNLIQAMSVVINLDKNHKANFFVAGTGVLNIVESDRIKTQGWIPHNELPKHLNELKLLILPSRTEGLPNIILEAMACGTPVLVTPVGAIPDFIIDGVTGFTLASNSVEDITEGILRVLNHPNLSKIAQNAEALVKEKFNFEATLEGYGRALNDI